jgi:hypothetical protein
VASWSYGMNLGKMDIVNILSAFHGYTSYLEISSATTGGEFSRIDPALLTKAHRLAYNMHNAFDDEAPIEFRSEALEIGDCVAELSRRDARYDIILVDPYHSYDCSYRDLDLALHFVSDNGSIVVHDVLPPSSGRIISPTFVPYAWCGVTFIAYVDFLMKEKPDFSTVDCDYGCGIIRKSCRRKDALAGFRDGWSSARIDHKDAFRYLSRHKRSLLNLQSRRDFVRDHDFPVARIYLDKTRRRRTARRIWKLWNT